MMVWEISGFVSRKLRTSAWGNSVVRQLVELVGKVKPQIVPFGMAQTQTHQNMTIKLPQIPTVLFSTSWSNRQLVMN